MSNIEDFEVVGSFTSMPDVPGVKFVVYEPTDEDEASGAIFQFASCPLADFPFQQAIHPGRKILRWDWDEADITKYAVLDGQVVQKDLD